MSELINYTKIQYLRSISWKRIIFTLCMIIFMFIGSYTSTNRDINYLDFLFVTLIFPRNIVLWLILSYIIFISNINSSSSAASEMFIRIGSRAKWWQSKILLLTIKTTIFSFTVFLLGFGFSLTTFSYGNSWSANLIKCDYIMLEEYLSVQPVNAFISIGLLLFLGMLCIGILGLVASTIIKGRFTFVITELLLWVGISSQLTLTPGSFIRKLYYNHINFIYHSFGYGSRYLSISQSMLYLAVVSLILYYLGKLLSYKKDLL